MTNLNTSRVICFCGKVGEWPIWSEKCQAKAKKYRFKDYLSGKLSIPKADADFDEMSEEGKKMWKDIELNDIAYTELIFPLILKLVMARLLLELSKDVRPRIILMEMLLVFRRYSRINMNLTLPLLWLSWTKKSENHHSRSS
jgi:hypothetical protein